MVGCCAICYHGHQMLNQWQQIKILGNIINNGNIRELLEAKIVPCIQRHPGTGFRKDNARPHITKNGTFLSRTETASPLASLFIKNVAFLTYLSFCWLASQSWLIFVSDTDELCVRREDIWNGLYHV